MPPASLPEKPISRGYEAHHLVTMGSDDAPVTGGAPSDVPGYDGDSEAAQPKSEDHSKDGQ